MFKSTIQVTLFSIVGIGISFFTQLVLAYYFGTTEDRDAYFVALTLPTYLTTLFVGSIGMMFLPYLVRHQSDEDPDTAIRFTAPVINSCFLVLLAIVLIGCLFSRQIVQMMLPASKAHLLGIGAYLFRIQLISVVFTVLSNLLTAVFQVRHSFLAPAIFPIITSLGMLLVVSIFGSIWGISSAAYGTLIGSALAFLFMLWGVLKQFKFRWHFTLQQPALKKLFLASLPLFGAGVLFRANTVFERLFAAHLPESSLSYVGTGNQIITILSTVVASGIATTSFPLLSRYYANNDFAALERIFVKVINLIVLIVFPMIVIFIACGTDIIKLFFEHGAFRPQDTIALYHTLLGFMGYFLFASIGNFIARMLYLSQNTWAAAIIGTIEVILYIALAIILTKPFQYVGLAVSATVAGGINIAMTLVFIKKRLLAVNVKSLVIRFGTMLIFSSFLLLLLILLDQYWLTNTGSFVRSLINVVLTGLFYWFLMAKVIKNNEYQLVLDWIKNRNKL